MSRHFAPRRLARLATTAVLSVGLAVSATTTAQADKGPGGGGSGGGGGNVLTPMFDFSDAYYRANGINPTQLVGRRNGTDGISVVEKAPDANHRDVRSRFTLPAYDTSGNEFFFTVLSDLSGSPFTNDAAGRAEQQLAESSPVYVFPTKDGDHLSPGNSRQADMIYLSHGYFSNNKVAVWVHVFVNWTPAAFNTSGGKKMLADLAARNGLALDGTPVITNVSDIDKLTKKGYVTQDKRPVGATGRWFICPVIKDPRKGAIAKDAFLATVRRADGTPLPSEQRFVDDFNSLQATGDYPR